MHPKINAAEGFADATTTQKVQHSDHQNQDNDFQETSDLEALKLDLILASYDLFLLPDPLMLPFLYKWAFLINQLRLRAK